MKKEKTGTSVPHFAVRSFGCCVGMGERQLSAVLESAVWHIGERHSYTGKRHWAAVHLRFDLCFDGS